MVDQVNQWATYGADIIPHPEDESLVIWWIGINDTGDTVKNASVWGVDLCSKHSLKRLKSDYQLHLILDTRDGGVFRCRSEFGSSLFNPPPPLKFAKKDVVYSKGLRNFLFINVPPEERSPAWVNDLVDGPVIKKNIILFNDVLQDFVESFQTTHPDANVLTFDVHAWFNHILDNGSLYGFSNVTGYIAFFFLIVPAANH